MFLLAAAMAQPILAYANSFAPVQTSTEAAPDAVERRSVVDAVIADLKEHYFDHGVAEQMAQALHAHKQAGDDAAAEGEALARLLTGQMRAVSHDMDLEVIFSEDPLPQRREPSAEDLARYRRMMEQDNCTFEEVEILPHNIGYLKLNSFPDLSVCRETAVAAMRKLNNAGAIIFDLRDNRGGQPAMVQMIASYLFDHPEYWFNPRENTTQHSWTQPVTGNKLPDKPVYVLTSHATISGAEQFCYDLKMLKRATIVGETTAGAAHAGVFYRIDDHFGIGIPEVKAINPYSKAGWAETGVEPDVKVKAADALTAAEKLAERTITNQ
jgi:hypothetical protein